MSDTTIFIFGSVVSGIVLASTLVNFLGPERSSTRSGQERETQPVRSLDSREQIPAPMQKAV